MKKQICALLALIIALTALSACGGGADETVSMYALSREMLTALNTEENMLYVGTADPDAADKFAYVSDMDYGLVDDFFLLYAENGAGNADEIAVIAVKNQRSVSAAEESLRAHLSKRTALYESYDPTQLEKLNGAVCETVGRYAVLVVAEDPAPVIRALHSFLSAE